LGPIRSYPPFPEDVDMRRRVKEVAEWRQKKKEDREQEQSSRALERQAREDAGELSPIRSDSSSDIGLMPSLSSEGLGHLFDDEPVEDDDDEEVVQRSPKRACTDEGPSAAAGTSRSAGQAWRTWLGSGSGAGTRQTSTALVTTLAPVSIRTETPAPTQPALDTRRLMRWRTVAR
jgi:hypothetical protein